MCAMHARKTARDAYFPTRFDDVFFTPRGDVAFKDTGDARRFADKVNLRDERSGASSLRPAEVAAMSLVHEIFHAVIGQYRRKNAAGFDKLRAQVAGRIGPDGVNETLRTFLDAFPTPAIYKQMQGEGGGVAGESGGSAGGRQAQFETPGADASGSPADTDSHDDHWPARPVAHRGATPRQRADLPPRLALRALEGRYGAAARRGHRHAA